MLKPNYFILLISILIFGCSKIKESKKTSIFAKAVGTHFEIDGKPFYYLGANFWAGMNLASTGEGGNRERLLRELDQMKASGITNLRIIAGTEGPSKEPYRIQPALQNEPGIYDDNLLEGLDFLLAEMGKRKMYAVIVMNDYWHWSGGYGQYLVWAKKSDSIPYPPPFPGGSWDTYQHFVSQFYANDTAQTLFRNHLTKIITRVNKFTGVAYNEDPAIFAWELANEPRASFVEEAFAKWVDGTSTFIKSIDKNHMVTTGSEGTPLPISGNDFIKDHSYANVDYSTLHIWIQNFGWFDPLKPEETYSNALGKAIAAIDTHIVMATKLNKPLVFEEFGIARDSGSLVPATPVSVRDKFYNDIFNKVTTAAKANTPLVGVNFWAWGGEGKPSHAEWQKGDDFIGDPPHEPQGWYSVYSSDTSTISIIRKYATELNNLK